MTDEDLAYAVKTYTLEQVKPQAEKCEKGGCPSYIHCFFGKPRTDSRGFGYALPVCARRILAEFMKSDRGDLTEKTP